MPKYFISFLIFFLSLFVCGRGVYPAFAEIQSDFPNYYTAAHLVLANEPLDELYDDEWFQLQIEINGIDEEGKFSPFPPLTAIVLLPFAHFTPIVAKQIWTVINILLLIANIFLLASLLKKDFAFSLLLFLLSGWALINAIKLGQLYLLLVFTILLGYKLYTENEKILSGIVFGMMIPIKYFPVIFLIYFIIAKEWRVVFATVITVCVLSIAGIIVMGWSIHSEFISTVFVSHVTGNLSHQNMFSGSFQSWASLLRRLYIYDESANPFPLRRWEAGFDIFLSGVIFIISAVTILTIKKITTFSKKYQMGFSSSLLSIAALLLSPATATYHFLLLVLPIAFLLKYSQSYQYRWYYFLFITTFAIIGYIPYSIFKVYDGMGILTLLAYPRLGMMCVLFIVATLFINRFYRDNPTNS
jgi:hypothetical protein